MSYADLTLGAVSAEFASRAVDLTINGTPAKGIFRFLGIDAETKRGGSESARADQGTLVVMLDEFPGIAYGDLAVIDGKTWRVMKKLKGGGAHTVKVLIERNRGRAA